MTHMILMSQTQNAPYSVYVSIRRHTSAYVSIRQHTSAYVPRLFASPCHALICVRICYEIAIHPSDQFVSFMWAQVIVRNALIVRGSHLL